jgi:hypothetical protein
MSSASPMEAVVSYLKNPGGGAADVSLNDSGKMTAGGIMAAIGFGGLFVTYMLNMPFMMQAIIYMLIFYVIAVGIMLGMSFLGASMGAGEKGIGEALMGAGSAGMFLGVVALVASLVFKIFLTSDNGFMSALGTTVLMGLVLMLGVVCYGNWINRYKVNGMMASIIAVFTISAGLGFGSWIFGIVMGGNGMGMGSLMRMF